jgi:hypothetical protein
MSESKRSVSEADLAALKSATHSLVAALGGAHDAAKHTRVSAQMLSNYGNPNDPSFMPIDVAVDLEARVGEPFVTRVMEMMAKRAARERAETYFKHMGDTSRAGACLTKAMADALEDGHADAHDRRAMKVAGFGVVLEALELVRDCEAAA